LQGPEASQVISEVGLLQSPKYFFFFNASTKAYSSRRTNDRTGGTNKCYCGGEHSTHANSLQQTKGEHFTHPHKIFWGQKRIQMILIFINNNNAYVTQRHS
jgi:hypothetical protein